MELLDEIDFIPGIIFDTITSRCVWESLAVTLTVILNIPNIIDRIFEFAESFLCCLIFSKDILD